MNTNDIIEKCAEIALSEPRFRAHDNCDPHQLIADKIRALKSPLPAETVSDAMAEALRKLSHEVIASRGLYHDLAKQTMGSRHRANENYKLLLQYAEEARAALEAAALAHADDGWRPEDMPPPDRVIHYNDGMSAPAMFHYSTEGCDARAIAREAGFEIAFVTMEREFGDDHPLMKAYVDDGEMSSVLNLWNPVVPDGWKLGGKTDSEDGPVALLLRPLPAPPKDENK